MATVYKYNVWCNNEQAYFSVLSDVDPTTCPNNNSHTIDIYKTYIMESYVDEPAFDRATGKQRVHPTARQPGTKTCYSGRGDDPTNINDVFYNTNPTDKQNGHASFYHKLGDDPIETKYVDFNTIENETWIYEGYLMWKDAHFNTVNAEIVPRVIPLEAAENTLYNLYGGYMLIPAAGDGTVQPTVDLSQPNAGLFQCLPNEFGEKPAGFWNADWNSTTKIFENISAAPTGTGDYNMFTYELCLGRIAIELPVIGSGQMRLRSDDVDIIPHGARLKITCSTTIIEESTTFVDHEWGAAMFFTVNRFKTK